MIESLTGSQFGDDAANQHLPHHIAGAAAIGRVGFQEIQLLSAFAKDQKTHSVCLSDEGPHQKECRHQILNAHHFPLYAISARVSNASIVLPSQLALTAVLGNVCSLCRLASQTLPLGSLRSQTAVSNALLTELGARAIPSMPISASHQVSH